MEDSWNSKRLDWSFEYHSWKANVLVDALSRKGIPHLSANNVT